MELKIGYRLLIVIHPICLHHTTNTCFLSKISENKKKKYSYTHIHQKFFMLLLVTSLFYFLCFFGLFISLCLVCLSILIPLNCWSFLYQRTWHILSFLYMLSIVFYFFSKVDVIVILKRGSFSFFFFYLDILLIRLRIHLFGYFMV